MGGRKKEAGVAGLGLAVAMLLAVGGCGPRDQAPPGARAVLKVASQKGATKALVLASHVLDGAPYSVEWSEFPSAQALLEALSANAVDLGGVGDAPFLFAYANDPKLKVVHVGKSQNGGAAVGVVVPAASPIRTATDLRGRRIATGKGSIGHYLLLRVLERARIPLSAVQVVYLSPGDAKAALANGAVDAWATWTPYTDLETRGGAGRVVVDGTGLLNSYLFIASTIRPSPLSDQSWRTFCGGSPGRSDGRRPMWRRSPRSWRRTRGSPPRSPSPSQISTSIRSRPSRPPWRRRSRRRFNTMSMAAFSVRAPRRLTPSIRNSTWRSGREA
jgi:ABC-type amino acid transport substrate-binding protein